MLIAEEFLKRGQHAVSKVIRIKLNQNAFKSVALIMKVVQESAFIIPASNVY